MEGLLICNMYNISQAPHDTMMMILMMFGLVCGVLAGVVVVCKGWCDL